LQQRHAVLVGHHRKRWLPLLMGLVVVIGCVVVLGRRGADALEEVNWYRAAPNWVLIRQTSSRDSQTQDNALGELARRAAIGKLVGSQLAIVVDRALEIQADRNIAWNGRWGQIIEGARAKGNVSDEQWRRYLRQAISFQIELRPVIRRGDFLVMRLSHPRSRVGALQFKVHSVLLSPLLTRSAQAGGDSTFPMDFVFGQASESTLMGHRFDDKALSRLADGPQVANFVLHLKVYDPASDPPESNGPVGAPLFTEDIQLNANWTLAPSTAQTVTTVVDLSLRAAVRASVLPQTKPEIHRFRQFDQNSAILRFDHYPPIDCMFDVYLRSGGREWKSGRLEYCSAQGLIYEAMLSSVDADHVDVILRPNPEAATHTIGISRIWGEEVVIPNVTVIDDPR